MENGAPQNFAAPDAAAIKKSNKIKLVWGLICLIGPTALIIVSLLLYSLANFIFSGTQSASSSCDTSGSSSIQSGAASAQGCEDELFAQDRSPGRTISNVILFLVGAVSVMTMFPGLVIGIILLATRKKVPSTP